MRISGTGHAQVGLFDPGGRRQGAGLKGRPASGEPGREGATP